MKEPVPSSPSEPVPPPDDGRCHTEALDLGAVLAIDRAARGALLARQEARTPALPRSAEAGPSSPSPAAPAVTVAAVAPVARVAPAHAPVEGRGHAELSPRPARVLAGAAAPPSPSPSPSPAPASMKTLEIDYSPASRLHRTRSLQVQRAARVAVIGAVAAAVGIGLWVLFSGGRGVLPAATHHIEIAPAPSMAPQAPSAQAPSTQSTGVDAPATTTVTAPPALSATMVPSAPSGASRRTSTPPKMSPSSTQAARPRPKTPPVATSEFPNQ